MRKKVLTIGIILFLCSCSSDLSGEIITQSASQPATFQTSTVPHTTAVTEEIVVAEESDDLAFDPAQADNYDARTEMLFTALKTNDIAALNLFGNTRSDGVYDFLSDIKFGDFTINSSTTADVGGSHPSKTYNVTISVLESNDERFPVGENTYEITALDAGFGPFFSPLKRIGDDTNKIKITDMIAAETLSDTANACYNLTLEMLPFYGRDTADSFTIPVNDTYAFYGGLVRFFSHIWVYVPYKSIDIYNKAAKQLLDIDTAFNETNIEPLWLGANMLDAVLVSETGNSVVIDYFADSLLLVKAFTVEYSFDTTNGLRFTSIENLCDSGFEPTRYTT
jgi:hypothetical protein